MSMDVGGGKGGVKSDINVTPLVDVMLVLLIIMMLVAPMLQQGVAVKLPKADNTVDKPEVQGQTVIAIAKDKRISSTPRRSRKLSSARGSTSTSRARRKRSSSSRPTRKSSTAR